MPARWASPRRGVPARRRDGHRGRGRRPGRDRSVPAGPAEPALELRDVALPTTAAEVTTALDELGKGRSRWRRAGTACPGAATWWRWSLVATEGDGGGPGRPGAGRPCSVRRRWSRSSTPCSARPVVGHDVKEVMRSLLPARHRPHGPRDGHRGGGLPARRLDGRVRAGRSCASRRGPADPRHRRARDRGPRRGPGGGRRGVRRRRHGAGFRRRPGGRGHGDAARRHRDARSCGSWPRWRWPASASTGPSCRRSPTRSRPSAATLQAEVQELRRARVQRELDAAAAHRALRRARPHPGQEDQDRLLDRRPDAREPARRAPDHRGAAALPRGREAALDLRREPAGRGGRPTGASTPRSARPWPAPGASPRTAPTCTTSRCAPSWASSSGGPSCRPRAARSWWPTTTRWSCAASPTSPGTRA